VSATLFYLSVLSLGEIPKAITLVKDVSRQMELQAWLESELMLHFAGRIVSIDEGLPDRWGRLVVQVGYITT
jgi:hypothetical protein